MPFFDSAIDKCAQMMQKYCEENPDLKRIIDQKKEEATTVDSAIPETTTEITLQNNAKGIEQPIFNKEL